MNTVMLWPILQDGIEGNVSCTIIAQYQKSEKVKFVHNLGRKPVIVNVKKMNDCFCGKDELTVEIMRCHTVETLLYAEPNQFKFVFRPDELHDSKALIHPFSPRGQEIHNVASNRPGDPVDVKFRISSRRLALPGQSHENGESTQLVNFASMSLCRLQVKSESASCMRWIIIVLVFLLLINIKRIFSIVSRVAALVAHGFEMIRRVVAY